MHVLIVYAHPEPTSLNAALKDAAVETIASSGHSVEVSDLYAEHFNPAAGRHDFTTVADPERFHYQSEQLLAATRGGFSAELEREQDRLRRADLIILQFPLWWGAPPAVIRDGSSGCSPTALPMRMAGASTRACSRDAAP